MKKTTRQNLVFLLCVLAVPAALFAWRRAAAGGTRAAGTAALLQYGETEQYIPLDSDAVYDIDTGAYTIHLRVQDGGIAFVDSPCPDHLCEGFGVAAPHGRLGRLPARPRQRDDCGEEGKLKIRNEELGIKIGGRVCGFGHGPRFAGEGHGPPAGVCAAAGFPV